MTDLGTVGLAFDDGVATVTLDRRARHNSLVPEFLDLIESAIGDIADSPARAVVLRSVGSSFSTGGDVAGFQAHRHDLRGYAERIVGGLNRVILGLVGLEQPVVVAVHGMVTGGSLGLVLAGDVVLVEPRATITPWYREVGFAPDGGWTAMLPAIAGRQRASEALLTNRTITAQEMLDWGIASRIVADGDAHAAADLVARDIAGAVPGSIRHTKMRLWSNVESIAAALDDERRRFVEQITTDEAAAGMTRFLSS